MKDGIIRLLSHRILVEVQSGININLKQETSKDGLHLEMLLKRLKIKFLHRIAVGDQKWTHDEKLNRKNSYVKPCQPATSAVL